MKEAKSEDDCAMICGNGDSNPMKNKLSLLSLMPLLLLGACGNASQVSYIGIVSAMDNEIQLLLEKATIKEEKALGGITYHIGTLENKPVIISRSGIGKVRASSGITSLLTNYNVSQVIFTGIAGGTRDEEKVLDQIIGTTIVEHDYGYLSEEGFVWCGGDPGRLEPGEYYACDEGLVKLAYESALKVLDEHRIYKGLIASGDQFIASSAYCDYLRTQFDAYACEMEGVSAAKVCSAFDTPFVVLRTLSDKADGNAHDSYADFGDLAARQSNSIVLKMLQSL